VKGRFEETTRRWIVFDRFHVFLARRVAMDGPPAVGFPRYSTEKTTDRSGPSIGRSTGTGSPCQPQEGPDPPVPPLRPRTAGIPGGTRTRPGRGRAPLRC
jgi:hypothetical protein